LGNAASIVEIARARILIDLLSDERASPTNWNWPKRFFSPSLDLSVLPAIDSVIISHDNYVRLGDKIRLMAQLAAIGKTRWLTPLGAGTLLRRFGAFRSSWFSERGVRSAHFGEMLTMR
jgi:L-ascorbate metabolism protein UlaG (beta-lactamase superfamily)